MCRFIFGEKHCDNCDGILAPYFLHCKSISSCAVFASFAQFHGSSGKEVAAKLAEREKEKAEMQAAAVLCKNIEDEKRKVSREDAARVERGWMDRGGHEGVGGGSGAGAQAGPAGRG
ncbi:hypothetical protein MMC17_000298 [Xylographa soralifera]|nr:hypothetical protein [Xylographa soralifera]